MFCSSVSVVFPDVVYVMDLMSFKYVLLISEWCVFQMLFM